MTGESVVVETFNGVAAVGVSEALSVAGWLIASVGELEEVVGFTVGETSVGSVVELAGWLASCVGAQATVINKKMQNRISAFIVTSSFDERFIFPESSDGLRSDCHLYPKGCCAKEPTLSIDGESLAGSKVSGKKIYYGLGCAAKKSQIV